MLNDAGITRKERSRDSGDTGSRTSPVPSYGTGGTLTQWHYVDRLAVSGIARPRAHRVEHPGSVV